MNISPAKSLKDKLAEKMEQDRKETEELTEKELKKLSKGLKAIVKRELLSILKDIRSETDQIKVDTKTEIESVYRTAQKLAWITKKQWIGTFLVGLCLLIGISAGSWGLMQYQLTLIKTNYQEIQSQKQIFDSLRTMGVSLQTIQGQKYLIVPQTIELDGPYPSNGNNAWRIKP